jgi:hypothetical protein
LAVLVGIYVAVSVENMCPVVSPAPMRPGNLLVSAEKLRQKQKKWMQVASKPRSALPFALPLQHITGDCDCETLRTNSLRGLGTFAERDPGLHQMYIASRRARLNEKGARGICSCCKAVEHVFMCFSFLIASKIKL